MGGSGAFIRSADVVLARCELRGGHGGDDGWSCPDFAGGAGLQLDDLARVAAFDSVLAGGKGGKALSGTSESGGPGLQADGSFAASAAWGFVSGGTIVGGVGGTNSGAGGPAVWQLGSFPGLGLLGALLIGGPGAPAAGAPGEATKGLPPAKLDGVARSLRVDSPLREQEAGVLEVRGVQGEVPFFFASTTGGFAPKLGKGGVFVAGLPLGPFALPPITDPSGVVNIPFVAPDLVSPNDLADVWLLQPLFVGPGGERLGAPTAFVLLDAGL